MKTLEEWLSLLERRHPVEIELGLSRISAVAEALDLTPVAGKVVVVAGTNGKGSCVRTLEALALKQGLAVGSYTSPHLLRYNERVRLQGHPVDNEKLCKAFETIDAHRGATPLTYFEVGTLAALLILSRSSLDLAILEVGLGGRFDAVNIVDGDIAVITSIALDHQHWLGDSRDAIGVEKAGIARAGKPVVCAEPEPPVPMLRALEELAVEGVYLGAAFDYRVDGDTCSLNVLKPQEGEIVFDHLPVPALPLPSVAAAVQVMAQLGYCPDRAMLEEVFAEIYLPGRYHKVRYRGRTVVFDVAHNPAAAGYLAQRLCRESGPIYGLVGVMADKDVDGFVQALATALEHWFVGDLPDNSRALSGSDLAGRLVQQGKPCTLLPSIREAFDAAFSQMPDGAILVICGSFFTVAAILEHMDIGYDF